MKMKPSLTALCVYGNCVILTAMAIYFGFAPIAIVLNNLRDPGLQDGTIPDFAFDLHHRLTARHDAWARERVASGAAENLSYTDVSGTEWPLFGAVFYLWSTEALQEAWEKDPSRAPEAPNIYARDSIESATALVLDPVHATWVKKHWGDDYLHRENLFYRMLLVSAMTSHNRLTGDERYLPLLREQVEELVTELDISPHGLLDDYPSECYPGDVAATVAAIRRADSVLGTDHSEFAQRALRAFTGDAADEKGLPAYMASTRTGCAQDEGRGCSNSYVCTHGAEVWPEKAGEWYATYERNFWQERWTAAGFREFSREKEDKDWYTDVDAGPCIDGHGFAASAFGLGAARAQGRMDHAYPLATEMLAVSWPLPNGRLLLPSMLSDCTDAPYLGECGILYNLTRTPLDGFEVQRGGHLPGLVLIVMAIYLIGGLYCVVTSLLTVRRFQKRMAHPFCFQKTQFTVWTILVLAGIATVIFWNGLAGVLLLLVAQLAPLEITVIHKSISIP